MAIRCIVCKALRVAPSTSLVISIRSAIPYLRQSLPSPERIPGQGGTFEELAWLARASRCWAIHRVCESSSQPRTKKHQAVLCCFAGVGRGVGGVAGKGCRVLLMVRGSLLLLLFFFFVHGEAGLLCAQVCARAHTCVCTHMATGL